MLGRKGQTKCQYLSCNRKTQTLITSTLSLLTSPSSMTTVIIRSPKTTLSQISTPFPVRLSCRPSPVQLIQLSVRHRQSITATSFAATIAITMRIAHVYQRCFIIAVITAISVFATAIRRAINNVISNTTTDDTLVMATSAPATATPPVVSVRIE